MTIEALLHLRFSSTRALDDGRRRPAKQKQRLSLSLPFARQRRPCSQYSAHAATLAQGRCVLRHRIGKGTSTYCILSRYLQLARRAISFLYLSSFLTLTGSSVILCSRCCVRQSVLSVRSLFRIPGSSWIGCGPADVHRHFGMQILRDPKPGGQR